MKRKQILIIVIVMAVLAVCITGLAIANQGDTSSRSGSIAIVSGGETKAEFDGDAIRHLESITVNKTIQSASYKDETGDFTGVPVRTLLQTADPDIFEGDVKNVVVRAEDGFVSSFSVEEVVESDSVLLVYEKDGEALPSKEEGGAGPFRIIVQDDEFGNRSAKYVNEIEVTE